MSEQHTPKRLTYEQLRNEAGVGPVCPRWDIILQSIEAKAETGPHYRELMAAYVAHREPIEREASTIYWKNFHLARAVAKTTGATA